MTMFPVGQASRFTLRESVTDKLRTAIADGSLAAGIHLAEVELSETLGVSRATLREALRQLQQEGLLTQDTRGRLSVRRVTASEVEDLFEVRLGLELIAVRRLCALEEREGVVTELRRKLDRLKLELDLAEDLDADLALHEAICELAANPILHTTWQGISSLIRITMMAAGPAPARANSTYERHAPIVELIAAGDAKAAQGFLTEHMATAVEQLLARMPHEHD